MPVLGVKQPWNNVLDERARVLSQLKRLKMSMEDIVLANWMSLNIRALRVRPNRYSVCCAGFISVQQKRAVALFYARQKETC